MPMVVVLFPSPKGVGVILMRQTELVEVGLEEIQLKGMRPDEKQQIVLTQMNEIG